MTSGATVKLTGNTNATTTADSSGNYTFTGLGNGAYTVTPAKAGIIFQPSSQNITVSNTSVTGVNFTAASGQLAINPSTFSFGGVSVGSSAQIQATLTATGGDVTLSNDTITGSGFGISGIAFPLTITSGTSTSFFVTFAPMSTGSASGAISFSNSASTLTTASLAGTGAGLTVSPGNLNFGQVLDGTTSAAQSVTLSAVGSSVTITSDSIVQNGGGGNAFLISGLPTLPLTIAAGQTTQVNVTFAPASDSPGTAAGTVTFASNVNSVAPTFAGTGVPNVALSWVASTTPSVTYNVYRCSISATACIQTQPTNFTKIATGIGSLTYTDSTVSSGQAYYYALTAVNTNSVESSLSTVSSAMVP